MIRYSQLIIIMLLSYNFASTQVVEWKKNGLTWENFKGRPTPISKNSFEFSSSTGWKVTTKKHNDTLYRFVKVTSYIQTSSSWVIPEVKSDSLLNFVQVVFNLLELSNRRQQTQINLYQSNILQPSVSFQEFDKRLQEYKLESENGQNREVIDKWLLQTNKELDETPNDIIPTFTKSKTGIGLYFGTGIGGFSGSLTNYCHPYPLFYIGYDVAISNYNILINMSLGGLNIKKDFQQNGSLWTKGRGAGIALLELGGGFTVYDKSKHKITPFLGFGITELTSKKQDGKLRLVDANFLAGVNYDFKFRKLIDVVNQTFFWGYKEYVELNIRTRLSITNPTFSSNLKGAMLNLSVGIGALARKIKTEQ